MTTIGKMRCLLTAVCLVITAASCKKDSSGPDKTPAKVTPRSTPQGISTGPLVTKQIGAAGGTLTSADKLITLIIPAGALNTSTAIGIEPISNTNVAGIGGAFRLTPHGQHFAKPVSITFSWAAKADSIGLPQTMGLAYQLQDGSWKFVGADGFDASQKTVTFKTTHFSDWSLMNEISLSPYSADLDPGAKQTIEALLFTENEDAGLFVPLPSSGPSNPYDEPGYPVGDPVALPVKYIKQWHLAGPGKMTKISNSTVQCEAPASIGDYTTAAVSMELNAPDTAPGKYQLVSNINLTGSSFIELSIAGATPDSFPASPVVHSGNRYLLANPSDEGGGYFLLTWTDGLGIHPFDLANEGTYFHFLTPQTNYVSRYRLTEQSDLSPSGGSVNVTRISNGRVEGTFNVTEAGYGPTLVPRTTAQGRFKVKLGN